MKEEEKKEKQARTEGNEDADEERMKEGRQERMNAQQDSKTEVLQSKKGRESDEDMNEDYKAKKKHAATV